MDVLNPKMCVRGKNVDVKRDPAAGDEIRC